MLFTAISSERARLYLFFEVKKNVVSSGIEGAKAKYEIYDSKHNI